MTISRLRISDMIDFQKLNGNTCGQRVKNLREFIGFSTEEFAKRLKMKKIDLEAIEKDESKPTIATLMILEALYGAPFEWLTKGTVSLHTQP